MNIKTGQFYILLDVGGNLKVLLLDLVEYYPRYSEIKIYSFTCVNTYQKYSFYEPELISYLKYYI